MTRSIHRFMRGAWGKKAIRSEEGERFFLFFFLSFFFLSSFFLSFFLFSFGRFRGCFVIRSLSVFVELYMN